MNTKTIPIETEPALAGAELIHVLHNISASAVINMTNSRQALAYGQVPDKYDMAVVDHTQIVSMVAVRAGLADYVPWQIGELTEMIVRGQMIPGWRAA